MFISVTSATFLYLCEVSVTQLVPDNFIVARASLARNEWAQRISKGLVHAVEDDEGILESPRKGMTADSCRVSEECASPRTCIDEESKDDNIPCDLTKKHCACLRTEGVSPADELIFCHESDNCENGEVCTRRNDITNAPYDTNAPSVCASEAFVAGSSLWEEVNKPPGSGLALDACKATSQCRAPRTCTNETEKDSNGLFAPCSGYREQSNVCSCDTSLCRHNFHCITGEVCAESKDKTTPPHCRSKERFSWKSDFYEEADYEYGTALTMDPCLTKGECLSPRSCISLKSVRLHCNGRERCLCLHLMRCKRSSDCTEGEICGLDRNRTFAVPFCASKLMLRSNGLFRTVEEDPSLIQDGSDLVSQEPDPPTATDPIRRDTCIAAHHLHHLPQESLLFSTHHTSAVLCDRWDNCATRGHIVKYKNTPMMMMTYCAVVECTEKLMPVNAPASFGTVVKSRRFELQFTALSARYETRLEEIFLSHVFSMHIFWGSK